MARPDLTTALPLDIACELRDALSRRQKELPPRWLAAHDALSLRERPDRNVGHDLDTIERDLALALIRDRLSAARPRGVVCLQPSASGAAPSIVDALSSRHSVTSVVAAELDQTLAIAMADRLRPAGASSVAIACDCTIDLPLPETLPRPRVYLCLGNALGRSTAVGAVRTLRVMRTTMTPGDSIVLGLESRREARSVDAVADGADGGAARHLAALGLVQSATGAVLDLSRFEFRPSYDRENCRIETHLVARRALSLEVPGICDVRLRKGESIRTSVSCVFDRTRVSAMLSGVGLTLQEWTTDADGSYVVALAGPAS